VDKNTTFEKSAYVKVSYLIFYLYFIYVYCLVTRMLNSTPYQNETQTESVAYSMVPMIIEGIVLLLAALYVMAALITHRIRSRQKKIIEVMAASGSVRIKRSKIKSKVSIRGGGVEEKGDWATSQ